MGRVVGIVTMSDVLRVPREKMKVTLLKDIMTENVLLSHLDETLLDALNKMTAHGVGRLPVVSNESNTLIGIITRTDIIKAYGRAIELLARSEPVEQTRNDHSSSSFR